MFELRRNAELGGSKTLYEANRAVYGLLRYGVKVQPAVGEKTETVWLVDWNDPGNNHFAIADEVSVMGRKTKRLDIVLYINGIAMAVLELKRSTVSVAEGIRQNLDSQKREYIEEFFSTVQLLMAANESEGLRYGVIGTSEKNWLRWKEAGIHPLAGDNVLLGDLDRLCNRERLLEIVHDFIVFDSGVKKICRHNQYFGVKAAQERVNEREGGIIWHTQGSGKSLTMVWLAKWIREHVTDGRVLILTDRTELDEQIEKVFEGVSEKICRSTSGADLMRLLNSNENWLICSLIHKFGASEEGDVGTYLEELKLSRPRNFRPKGELFVFIDECHRTQSGKLHRAMKSLLEGSVFFGFTGTPLLKADKRNSLATFGNYIHTYKYDEAVRDGAVLDLRYEARDIDQNITSQDRVDEWFKIKTRGLNDIAKARLKERWATMQKVQSSRDRLRKIVADILMDMGTKDRLISGRGNALLISDSIHSACSIFEILENTDLKGKCGVVTSYRPSDSDIKGEESGEGHTDKILKYSVYRKMLAEHFDEPEETAVCKFVQYEKEVKKRFIEFPGQMKLIIVVDKLLTGFDAPPATYLYIDKQMRDHGLFQAICRVNRLDREDKQYGYIIDYKDLFRSLEKSVKDYTGEAFDGYDKADIEGLLRNRLELGRGRLDQALDAVKALCEPVSPPYATSDYLRYFCAVDSGNIEQLKNNEPKRIGLYRLVGELVRAYVDLANEMRDAGYSEAETQKIREEVDHYEKVRQEIRLASGDYIDMKMFEPSMRHLLDNYIRAEESEKLSQFDDLSLVQLLVDKGERILDTLPEGMRGSQDAVAETIENNVRRIIVDKSPVNPRYYEKMSILLDDLIVQRRQEKIDYRNYLNEIVELAQKVQQQEMDEYPSSLRNITSKVLYDNLRDISGLNKLVKLADEGVNNIASAAAQAIDFAVRRVKKADWRGNLMKEREIRNEIKRVILDEDLAQRIFEIVKTQSDY